MSVQVLLRLFGVDGAPLCRPVGHAADRTPGRYRLPMPQPGDPIPYSFSVRPRRCYRLVYSAQLQATHCRQPPAWKGIWKDAKGKSWYVEACREHAPKVSPATV